jgi:hypothetical protein
MSGPKQNNTDSRNYRIEHKLWSAETIICNFQACFIVISKKIIIFNLQWNRNHINDDTSENEELGNNGNCQVKKKVSNAGFIISGNFTSIHNTVYIYKYPHAT